jgi:SagB-type dehydrogenase family enzyme
MRPIVTFIARRGAHLSRLLALVALSLTWCTQSRADRADVPSSSTSVSTEEGARLPVKLPTPRQIGRVSLEETLARRRSVRELSGTPLSDAENSQLLWAAQGITHRTLGLRTAPSAGALYPLEVYLVIGAGVFHYEPRAHELHRASSTDVRNALFHAALQQDPVRDAPSVFVLVGVYERTARKYGLARAERYVQLEAGHAAQNLLLQAAALDLAAVPVGAFNDDEVRRVLELPPTHQPLYLIPVGHPAP